LYLIAVAKAVSNPSFSNHTEDATKKRADSMGFIFACQDKHRLSNLISPAKYQAQIDVPPNVL
jgi:hypothetical protein